MTRSPLKIKPTGLNGSCLVWLLAFASCGSLEVTPYEAGSTSGLFYPLSVDEFVVTVNGLDKDGKPVPANGKIPHIVSLVTRADPTRAFMVRNDPAWFSNANFSVTRELDGRATIVNGSSTGQAQQVVQSLVSVVASVAAAARPAAEVDAELVKHESAKTKLVDEIGTESDPAKLEQLQKALVLTQDRIDMLLAKKAAKEAKSVPAGVRASGSIRPDVSMATSAADAKNKSKQITDGSYRVFLVPID